MIPLLIVAAGGLGRETAAAAQASGRYEVIGFVDDDPARHGDVLDGVKVLGGLDVVADHPDVAVVLCAGRGRSRASLEQRLALDEQRYATVVHPGVLVPDSCTVGAGSVLLAGVVLTAAVQVGRHVVVMPNTVLTHDDVVADHATLCAGVTLGGSVTIGPGAYVGMSASVRQNLSVGADAVLGMGAVALRDVPAGQTWYGNPARPQRPRPTKKVLP